MSSRDLHRQSLTLATHACALVFLALATAPLVYRIAGIAAVVVERVASGRWPDYGDAKFKSGAFLTWMTKNEWLAWLYAAPPYVK